MIPSLLFNTVFNFSTVLKLINFNTYILNPNIIKESAKTKKELIDFLIEMNNAKVKSSSWRPDESE